MHTVTMHTEKYDHNMKDKQGEIFSEAIYDSGSSKHSDLNSCVTNGSGSSIDSERQVNIMTGDESGKNNYSDTRINGSKSVSVSTRRSSSSSSSESSLDGFFVMDTLNFTTSSASTSKSRKDYVSSSHSSSKSEDDNSVLVPTSTFQVSNVTHSQKGFPPTSSPSIQVMDRSGGYDPARIPSAVFHRNSNPLEWSSASNESLFSLQIENNSFSREHMFGEVSMSPELTKSGEMNLFSRTSSILTEEVDTARKSADVENPQTNKTSDNAFKLEERLSEDQNESMNSDHAASSKSSKLNVSSLSHDSENSTHSFAFPIKKHPRSLCYYSNCSWAFCYTCPTCCHTWPSCKCSNCGWAFCYSWNFSYTKGCGHASTHFDRN
ncbi:PREDICTED: serine-rich adhesin for platelets-like isoform X2 [Lupinus angustifolius]|uniref:serine-rich adhesin for platelets-like isoform X2 n=1 Tax=Lupinus angustifolius TaxID=3871 RepID=UPI00092FA1C7|nr:PREDICTED: serine-rich adhesin for platelets-like isoform X2 [Lupinus angustifolius]